MVNLFPYVAIRHQVDDVPTTVVNGVKTLVGAGDEAEAVEKMMAVVAAAGR